MKYLFILMIFPLTYSCQNSDDKIVYREAAISTSTPDDFRHVTNEYGELTVKEGDFTGTSKILPWSSWWFPTKDKFLFLSPDRSKLAPLQKFDLYVERKLGRDPQSALFEEREVYDDREVNWAGLCHAWAIASVLHHEPRFAVSRQDIEFNVGDQKALLLKSYENVKGLDIYGHRYNGAVNDEYEDIYADQFHRFAQYFLFEKELPFLMDYDPSFPVWTVPVYKIKFTIKKIDEGTASVKAWVEIASPFVDSPNFVGTKKSVKFYEYNLYGSWMGEELLVDGSEWTNASAFDHPDFVIGYPSSAKRGSLNKGLSVEQIDEIVKVKLIEVN
jgi:hypothetical protein